MLTKEDIKALIEEKTETINKDFKEGFVWSKQNKSPRIEIIKDIMAMANTRDGGKIVIGVTDKAFKHVGITEKEFYAFDTTPINQLLQEYADPPLSCDVVKMKVNNKLTVVIDIPEFAEEPIICKKTLHSKDNEILLTKGAVYIRTKKNTSEAISNVDEMRRILGRGITKKSEEIFETIKRIVSGSPIIKKADDKNKKFDNDIKEALGFVRANLENIEEIGRWELVVHPHDYNDQLIDNPVEAGKMVEQSKVRLRGWDFPHIDVHGNFSNFNNGKQSITGSERVPHSEAWRLYKSGLFVWSAMLGEDMMGFSKKGLSILYFVSRIYSITEMTLFLKRLYLKNLKVKRLHLQLKLYGAKDRKLEASQGTILGAHYICKDEPAEINEDIQTVELKVSHKAVAREIIKKVFMLFNWNDPSEKMLEDWQNKLIEKGG
ncbi:ATP-binding protein [Patescibacteria group bacterium]|nr:ATP-binding protein [Patescibacteria group bacterium]MBU0776982.1 ATP-binding protein [Patescibacteria group bacterium]MBU0845588.1 ATP-binding protein [Patescibacteria group bacterium]MBU0923011.1 ATP-binding protein [Patescibacteria group bacterium]MBU1066333.1 ATP-binding protein [Patescibacteria group bacterium]